MDTFSIHTYIHTQEQSTRAGDIMGSSEIVSSRGLEMLAVGAGPCMCVCVYACMDIVYRELRDRVFPRAGDAGCRSGAPCVCVHVYTYVECVTVR